MAVIHENLRDRPEQKSPEQGGPEEGRGDERYDVEPDEARQRPKLSRQRKGSVGGGHQTSGKGDAFRLVSVQELRAGPTSKDGGEFPGQVDGVTNPGVHPLSAHRAVDVGRVAEQEGAADAKVLCDAVVYAVRREPVDLVDSHLQSAHDALPNVIPSQRLVGVFGAFG